jgi:hypothetical protein
MRSVSMHNFSSVVREAAAHRLRTLRSDAAAAALSHLLAANLGPRSFEAMQKIAMLSTKLRLPEQMSAARTAASWAAALPRLSHLKVAAGQQVIADGEDGTCAYWLLTGTAERPLEDGFGASVQELAAGQLSCWDACGFEALRGAPYRCASSAGICSPVYQASHSRLPRWRLRLN